MLIKALFPTIRIKKKDRILTGNLYRNAHWSALAKSKREYTAYAEELVKSLPKYKTLTIHYTLYFSNKRKKDVDNLISPLHKFFADALTTHGSITDDNHTILTGFSCHFGGYEEEDYAMIEIDGELDEQEN